MSAPLDASKLKITKSTFQKPCPPKDQLTFGKDFTSHMLSIEWDINSGWADPEIKPYGPLSLDPAACVFQYGFELFEGMKAYRDKDNNIRLFRPSKNMSRMNKSAESICLPNFNGDELIELIGKLIDLDKDFVPEGRGYSLYIRPTLIGTTSKLGVGAPDKALLYVICFRAGPYYKTALKLEATDYAVRAWPGGVGDKKLGGNYSPCIKPQLEASSRGYQQNLWLFGPKHYITEAGIMNFFVVIADESGKKELITAPLDGTILEGVTRDSVITLAKERLDPKIWTISERYCTIGELIEASKKGLLVEAFCAGTGAIISPIEAIGWHGKDIEVPLQPGKHIGELTEKVAEWIYKIQYGEESSEWSVVVSSSSLNL